jgi:excisionase family DNA binding protein
MENQRILLRVSAAAELLDISRSKLYELINQGQVPHVRIGNSLRLPVESLRADWGKDRRILGWNMSQSHTPLKFIRTPASELWT